MTRRPALYPLASAVLAAWLVGCASDPEGDPAASPTASSATVPAPEETGTGGGRLGAAGSPGSAEGRQPAGGWATLTDEPSGARFALPGRVDRQDDTAAVEDGSRVAVRNYAATMAGGTVELGFNVIDAPGDSYDLDAGVSGVEDLLGGDVVESTDIEVDGHRAVDVEVSYGDGMLVLFQLIRTEEHVMQPLASGPESDRGKVEAVYERLNTSVEVD